MVPLGIKTIELGTALTVAEFVIVLRFERLFICAPLAFRSFTMFSICWDAFLLAFSRRVWSWDEALALLSSLACSWSPRRFLRSCRGTRIVYGFLPPGSEAFREIIPPAPSSEQLI